MITQFIEFYSEKAVSKRLEMTVSDLKSEKIFAQLLILSSKIDNSSTFSSSDRDTIMRLLDEARSFPQISSESGFPSVLEDIVDSFAAADAQAHVDKICNDYELICFDHDGIAPTLLQHYGRLYIGIEDITSERARGIRDRLEKVAVSMDSKGAKGAAVVFRSLARFRELDGSGDAALTTAMRSYSSLSPSDGAMLHELLNQLSDSKEQAIIETPEVGRTVDLTTKFKETYQTEIRKTPKKSEADHDRSAHE